MNTFLIELNGGVVIERRAGSLAAAWRYAERVFGDNLRRVTAVRIADAA